LDEDLLHSQTWFTQSVKSGTQTTAVAAMV